jgi:tRNA U34 5-carboxymethylaminomethyl modifying GTPase MnmE/TrmE
LIEENCKESVKKMYVVNKIDANPNVERIPGHHYVSCKANEGIDDLLTAIKQMAM